MGLGLCGLSPRLVLVGELLMEPQREEPGMPPLQQAQQTEAKLCQQRE